MERDWAIESTNLVIESINLALSMTPALMSYVSLDKLFRHPEF